MLHVIPTWLFSVFHVKINLVPIVTRMFLFGPYVCTQGGCTLGASGFARRNA
jgi:hypothetical protein